MPKNFGNYFQDKIDTPALKLKALGTGMQGEGKSFMSLFKIHNLPDIENVNIKGIFAELFKADKVKRRMKNNHFIKDEEKILYVLKVFGNYEFLVP